MDLLKDITRELRGGNHASGSENGSGGGGQSRTAPSVRGDSDRRDSPSGRTEADDESPSGGESVRDATHVCSFCDAEFDASRDVCPECDAEIVLRGER